MMWLCILQITVSRRIVAPLWTQARATSETMLLYWNSFSGYRDVAMPRTYNHPYPAVESSIELRRMK